MNVGRILESIGRGDYFLNLTSVAETLTETINKWNLFKLKNFCKAKVLSIRQNSRLRNEKNFINLIFNRALISK